MRFGLIGYGLWGRHHATAIRKAPGAVLAAIACRSEATAAAARRDFPDVPVHRRLPGAPRAPRRGRGRHRGPQPPARGDRRRRPRRRARTSCSRSRWPPPPEQCDRLLAAARRTRAGSSAIGHELRLSTQWGRVKAIIDAGDIGEPMYALHTLFRFPYRPGAEGWRHDRARVGSWILEEPVHAFDSLMWYLEGHGDPVSVLAARQRPAAGGRHGGQLHRAPALPRRGLRGRHRDAGRLRVPPRDRGGRPRGLHPRLVVGHAGPHAPARVRAEGEAARPARPRPSPWPRPASCSSWRRSSRRPWWRSASGGRWCRARRRASA